MNQLPQGPVTVLVTDTADGLLKMIDIYNGI